MGDDGSYSYSARDIRHALREADPGQAPRGLLAGFKAFVERDGMARARLAGNHPKRHRLLGRADGLPFTVHQDLMQLGPESVFTSEARDALVHPWHLESEEGSGTASEAEAALLLIRFLTVLLFAAGRTHPFVVLLVLSHFLDQDHPAPIAATGPTPEERPARTVKPPGQLVLAEPRLARAPNLARPSSPYATRTVPACARPGGAL
jgi:hypothetical protein